jgi:hypothetical protein
MKKITVQITSIFIFLFGFVSIGFCQDTYLNIKGGLLGAGLEVERSFNDKVSARVGFNYFPFDYNGTEDDIEYDFELDLMSLGVFLDWHPFEGSFRLTGGVIYNGNSLDSTAQSAATYEIGDQTYTGNQIGTLNGEIDFNDFAPYAGLGWNTAFGKDRHWGFIFELGVMFQGSPEADLTATGPIASQPDFMTELAKEEDNLQDDLDDFNLYPNISIGLSYRF